MKINSKWILDINLRAKNIKLLEQNIGVNLCDLELGNGFLGVMPKAQGAKKKIDKWHHIKIKNFSAANNTVKK